MPGTRPQPGAGQPRRAVILTALGVEYMAVRAHLTDCREETHKGTVYEIGKFNPPGFLWEILIAEIGSGNPGSAIEAERSIDYFNPEVAFFVGVAGGLKDVKLGDVVASTKVYGYETGKAGLVFQPRPDIGRSTYRMEQWARAGARKGDWRKRIIGPESPKPPEAFVAPTAAGEKVVAYTNSATYKFLKSNFSDALAVEMEGIGFLSAIHASPSVEALIIRGISDLVRDKSRPKEKNWQVIASCHAAAFCFEVLANIGASYGSIKKAVILTTSEEKEDEGSQLPKHYHVFLSYSHSDSEWVYKLATRLAEENINVWLDKWILIPGKDWQPEMAKGLEEADSCAICIGGDTPTGWFKQEIQKALNRQVIDQKFRVIPVLLPEANIINVNDFLELRTWVDFRHGSNHEYEFYSLICGIKGVPPGRGPKYKSEQTQTMNHIERLEKLNQIKHLVEKEILIEYQRKIVESFIYKE